MINPCFTTPRPQLLDTDEAIDETIGYVEPLLDLKQQPIDLGPIKSLSTGLCKWEDDGNVTRWLAEFLEEGTELGVQSIHYVTTRLAVNNGILGTYLGFVTIVDDNPKKPVYTLNKATQNDHFPLHFVNQILDEVARHELYTFIDGYLGYNQMFVCPKDYCKIAFLTPWGTFIYLVMRFGQCSSPTPFQPIMTFTFLISCTNA